MALHGDDAVAVVDKPCSNWAREQPCRTWAQCFGQRSSQRRTGGVDGAVGLGDVQGRAAFDCRECSQEWIGLAAVEVEQNQAVTAVEPAQ